MRPLMDMFWQVFAAALGFGIGDTVLTRMVDRYGKVPLWFRAFWILIALVVVWLGLQTLSADRPDWATL